MASIRNRFYNWWHKKDIQQELVNAILENTEESLRKIQQILASGFDPNLQASPVDPYPLCIAAKHDNVQAVKLLIQYGANPNKDFIGSSALRYAAEKMNIELVKFLDPLCNADMKGSVVYYCIRKYFSAEKNPSPSTSDINRCIEILEIIVNGANLNGNSPGQQWHGKAALAELANSLDENNHPFSNHKITLFNMLLKNGANVDGPSSQKGFSVLQLAIVTEVMDEQNWELILLLVKHSNDKATIRLALNIALYKKTDTSLEAAKALIAYQNDINTIQLVSPNLKFPQDSVTTTLTNEQKLFNSYKKLVCIHEQFLPIVLAAEAKNVEIVTALLKIGADVTIKDQKFKHSAITFAIRYNHWAMLQIMIAEKELKAISEQLSVALKLAIETNSAESLALVGPLLKAGANIDQTGTDTDILSLAAANGRVDATAALLISSGTHSAVAKSFTSMPEAEITHPSLLTYKLANIKIKDYRNIPEIFFWLLKENEKTPSIFSSFPNEVVNHILDYVIEPIKDLINTFDSVKANIPIAFANYHYGRLFTAADKVIKKLKETGAEETPRANPVTPH